MRKVCERDVQKSERAWYPNKVRMSEDFCRAQRTALGFASVLASTLPNHTTIKNRSAVLLSQSLAGLLPSALRGLTTEFGMGSGVTPSV